VSGYVYPVKTFVLIFADPDMDGLKVEVSSVPSGVLLELDRLTDPQNWQGLTRAEQKPRISELYTLLAGAVQSWNLTDRDGEPVPTTVEGMWTQEWDLMRAIIWAWYHALIEVPAPLPRPSGDGGQSVEASIPMEVLSPSQLS